jgi:hypothetical protein
MLLLLRITSSCLRRRGAHRLEHPVLICKWRHIVSNEVDDIPELLAALVSWASARWLATHACMPELEANQQ